MRKYLYVLLSLVLVVTIFVTYKAIENHKNQLVDNQSSQLTADVTKIGRIGEGYFNFEVADTPNERTQGLSGRDPLADTDALLFVFEKTDEHCFWMKDMKFNIDILWFDENKSLIYEKRNVSPESYPESFCPSNKALYVVEVTAGVTEKNQIKLGDTLDIEL